MNEIRFLEVPFQRLIIGPDETIVIIGPQHMSMKAQDTVLRQAKAAFGTDRVILLEETFKLGAVKIEDDEAKR